MKKFLLIVALLVTNIFAFEHLTVENIDEKLKDKKVILDFYATWCPPCKIIAKNLNSFDEIKPKDVVIYKVDIDAQRDLIKRFDVKSIPTIVFLNNGELKHLQVGIQTVDDLKKNTKKYLLK